MSTFDGSRSLSSSSCRTSLPVFAVPPQSDSVSSTRPREEWVAYSFERFIAAIKTRYTPHPDDMYSPTRQPAKRCREQSLWRQPTAEVERAACAEIDMARRPSSRTMPLARACGSVEGSTARRGGGAPTAPLPHHSRTTPTGSGAAHMELRTAPVHRSRAQLAERGWARWRAPSNGGGVPTGAAFPRAGHTFLC